MLEKVLNTLGFYKWWLYAQGSSMGFYCESKCQTFDDARTMCDAMGHLGITGDCMVQIMYLKSPVSVWRWERHRRIHAHS